MNNYELTVTDKDGKNSGVLTVKAKSESSAAKIAANDGYRVHKIEAAGGSESVVAADAEYNRMRRAVFIGTLQAHLLLFVCAVVLTLILMSL